MNKMYQSFSTSGFILFIYLFFCYNTLKAGYIVVFSVIMVNHKNYVKIMVWKTSGTMCA